MLALRAAMLRRHGEQDGLSENFTPVSPTDRLRRLSPGQCLDP